MAANVNETNDVTLTKPIRCIVKLGGAAITCKNELEKINEKNLEIVSSQLRQTMISSENVVSLDWSKRPGTSDISCNVDSFGDQLSFDANKFIVVHGAGSFGHFQASKSGVHKGGMDQPLVKAGFVATRISVTTLNLEIVRALARVWSFSFSSLLGRFSFLLCQPYNSSLSLEVDHSALTYHFVFLAEGIPSIGMSPFSCGWSTSGRNIASADLPAVAKAIESGFIPVLHGDAVFDDIQGCTILSGDVIIRHLAEHLKPEYVVFLTDVFGVYDRPPSEPDAVLLKEIAVSEDGRWSVIKPTLQDINKQVEITVAAHDTTGGMVTKISEAAMIAKLGIDVYIVKAATSHSLRALSGEVRSNVPDDWLGTVIRRTSR
ncbi:hypothetical protein EZV62_017886 [Acer yangbiense]|uniref:Isopentenyl phosphate kinase n=1 Tax=Acer yangbiense TaxID=1000413 RepID=A0A5C7HHQ4_9ROSI|nr:hypothetical protein EZV62_017886 [Acer yangbiense]